MPGKVKVRILAGRNLPVMDKSSDTSDAFVEVKLGSTTYKTEVYRRSLNPYWNSEWFRFEIDDEELQDEPLQIRIMDYDTYSANDAIGKVYIDLNPLLQKDSRHVLSGWFPIYDTMHGIRGEVNCIVKVALFSDANRYRQSSCGFKFFYCPKVPDGYFCEAVLGFVEELVVNHDPEYQWIDKIRTPRASNEARQTLFSKISGEVQRKIGIKAMDLGGNAVIGYQQHFDLEGESGIVVRGIGTAVIINQVSPTFSLRSNINGYDVCFVYDFLVSKIPSPYRSFYDENLKETCKSASPTVQLTSLEPNLNKEASASAQPKNIISNNAASYGSTSSRRLSDSDLNLNVASNNKSAPSSSQENTTASSGGSGGGVTGATRLMNKLKISPEKLQLLEYPFLTLKTLPPGLIANIGGIVSARSVKLLDQINNPDDPETRDAWWTELRKEIRSHKKTLGCNAVLGYTETAYINDEICILSACGTAALLKTSEAELNTMCNYYNSKSRSDQTYDPNGMLAGGGGGGGSSQQHYEGDCRLCHIPYQENQVPFPTNLLSCQLCGRAKVPDVLFMTIEPCEDIPTAGFGTIIQSRVCRTKRESKGEACAKEISDSLPFLEYELHRQLLTKLKIKGMNGLFNISISISFGENMLAAVATGTGAYLTPLNPATPPKISSGKGTLCSKLSQIQVLITESINRNRDLYNLNQIYANTQPPKVVEEAAETGGGKQQPTTASAPDDTADTTDNKESCVLLEVDDTEDADIISLMIDSDVPKGFDICNSEHLPGKNQFMCNLQMFSQVYRTKLTSLKQFGHQFDWIIQVSLGCLFLSTQYHLLCPQSLFVKFRALIPCCLADLQFHIDIPEADLIQITVTGTSIGMGAPTEAMPSRPRSTTSKCCGFQQYYCYCNLCL